MDGSDPPSPPYLLLTSPAFLHPPLNPIPASTTPSLSSLSPHRTPSIAKYGMLSDYGVSDDVEDNPLAQMNQAECLLALYMLHKEKGWEEEEEEGGGGGGKRGPSAVDFLDADRLEVLQGGSKA